MYFLHITLYQKSLGLNYVFINVFSRLMLKLCIIFFANRLCVPCFFVNLLKPLVVVNLVKGLVR